jgi:hypothetical protein
MAALAWILFGVVRSLRTDRCWIFLPHLLRCQGCYGRERLYVGKEGDPVDQWKALLVRPVRAVRGYLMRKGCLWLCLTKISGDGVSESEN